MSTSKQQNLQKQILFVGIAGSTAVSIQTLSLVWANSVLKKQNRQGLTLFQSALKIYQKGGIKNFFKGTFTPFIYNSFARFGDTTSNYLILNFFKNNSNLSQIPLFIQSACSWALASTWRLAITPLTILSNPQTLGNLNSIKPGHQLIRSYLKFIKPQILSLYSWFLVQNYLISHTKAIKFSQNSFLATLRFSTFGFLSMISYDFYLKLKHSVWPTQLPSKYWFNKVFFKGLFGVVFCTSSQFIKEELQNIDNEIKQRN